MEANLLLSHFTSAAVFVWALQLLKSAAWFPWLEKTGQVWLKRGSSIVYAICANTGIHQVWSAGPSTMPGSHVLMITIPALSVMAVTVWHWIGQYAFQETIYKATADRAPLAPTPMLQAMARMGDTAPPDPPAH